MTPGFPHESLDCYHLAVRIARWVAAARFPARHAPLADQATRAAQSVVLNIAEGCSRGGPAGRNQYRIALGSAAEVAAVLDPVDLPDVETRRTELKRVGAMLWRMSM